MSTLYTGDSRFVLSGSDDGNVRVWKAHASDKLGVITARERAAIEYRESLKTRWRADAEIGKVSRYVMAPPLFCRRPRRPLIRLRLPGRGARQDAAPPEAGVQGSPAQEDDARGTARQGGAAAQAHAGGRAQAQGRAEKGCHHGAVVGLYRCVVGARATPVSAFRSSYTTVPVSWCEPVQHGTLRHTFWRTGFPKQGMSYHALRHFSLTWNCR